MKIFISWSGEASHAVSLALRDWLPSVLPYSEPWVSSEDIHKGTRWSAELWSELERTWFCLACITPGVEAQPWVNFEAGAVSKIVARGRVSPVLFGLAPTALTGLPLSQFQATEFTKGDMLRLLHSINSVSDTPLAEDRVVGNMDFTWAGLEARIGEVPQVLEVAPSAPEGSSAPRTGEEDSILTLLAQDGGLNLEAHEVAHRTGLDEVRAQYFLDRLVDADLVHASYSIYGGAWYAITKEGRAYVVESGLAGQGPA